ncbi:MAG: TolC family protein, partial [Proteobacteria bacterium]|nr:TolC family protein [Pseudomonadota bacterium]
MKDSNTRHSIHKGPVQLLILGFFLLSVKTGWAQQTDKTKSLSLDEAVDRAIARASRVEQAQYEVDAQTEAKRGAWTNVGPHAQVQYQEARFPDQQIVDLGRGPFVLRDDVTKTGSLTVSQTITGLWAAVEYSRMKGKQADLSYEGLRLAKQDAGFGAAEAFLNAYQAQEQERIASSSIETAKRQYNDALALQRVGRQGQGDVLKFQLALSLAENRAAKAHAAKQIAMMALRQVIRAQDDEVFDLQKDLPKLQEEKIELQQGIESALTLRPELKQAELGTEIAGFSKKIAYAQYVPNLSVFKKWDKNFAEPTGLGGKKESNYI